MQGRIGRRTSQGASRGSGWLLLALAVCLAGNRVTAAEATPPGAAPGGPWVPFAAHLDAPRSLAGPWAFRPGDDPAWSAPDLDDRNWAHIEVPGPWGRQGYRGQRGMAWYRVEVSLGDEAAAEARRGALGLRLGSVDSSYQLFIGGRHVGGVGGLPPHPAPMYDRHAVFAIPAEAVADDGRIAISLRVWHAPVTRDYQGGVTNGPVQIGRLAELERALLLDDLPYLALVVLFGVAGLYHLYLFWQRPSLREYLWYGASALLLGGYTFLRTQVRFALSEDYVLLKNLEFLALYLIPVTTIQFFYGIFLGRVPRLVRAVQVGSGAFALLAIATPGLDPNVAVLSVWQYTMLAMTAGTFLLVLRLIQRGHPEARLLVGSFSLLSLTVLNDILRNQGLLQTPSLIPYGFALFVLSMAGSLANRFARTHHELEELNLNLEDRVREQTLALEERASELESKNKELEDAYQQLHEASLTDPLTGLRNRRFYLEHIGLDVARALRDAEPAMRGASGGPSPALVFLVVDIDHFKQVNDRHGHGVGDQVLAQVGRVLRTVCRESDYLVRWGGEEFLVVSRLADRAGAPVLAERIRAEIDALDLGAGVGPEAGITASVGFACFPLHESDPAAVPHDAVLGLADACLYRVKELGRDGWLGAVRGTGSPRQPAARRARLRWDADGLEVVSSWGGAGAD